MKAITSFKMQKSPGDQGAELKEMGWWAAFRVHWYFFIRKSSHSQTTDELRIVSMRKKREKRREKESLAGGPSWKGVAGGPWGHGERGPRPSAGDREGPVREGREAPKDTASVQCPQGQVCLSHLALVNALRTPLAYLYIAEIRAF